MKQQILILLTLAAILAVLFYLGGYILLVGLGVIGLTTIIFLAFALGAKWSQTLMTAGARLAIESASRNDEHDATKIKALSELTREAIKAKNHPLNNYPALPPFNAVEGSFTIAGLEDEEMQN